MALKRYAMKEIQQMKNKDYKWDDLEHLPKNREGKEQMNSSHEVNIIRTSKRHKFKKENIF